MPQGKVLSGGTCIFYNVVNPADGTQAGWLSPCAEFYYCHACTQRMVEGIGTWDKHDNICVKKHHGKTGATMFLSWRQTGGSNSLLKFR